MDPRLDLLGGGRPDLLSRLTAWAAQLAVDEAVRARVRQRWLRQAAGDEATFAGTLLDLAERRAPVVVTGRGGRRHRGTVVAVGADFCALRLADDSAALLAFAGIASVRPEPHAEPAGSDRAVEVDVDLAEALAAVAEDRPRVLVVTMADADGLAGELRAVGRDVLTVQLDGTSGSLAYVPLVTVAEIRTA